MLWLSVPAKELFDETRMEFITTEATTLQLEHSLVSISKWESKWHKPYLSDTPKTDEESVDYIRCMLINQHVDPMVFMALGPHEIEQVRSYIEDPMTATTFSGRDQKRGKQVVTAELIYYYMITLGIPFECQKWHLNRLMTLIRVCSIKSQPQKKMGKNEIYRRNSELNALRRARMGSKG